MNGWHSFSSSIHLSMHVDLMIIYIFFGDWYTIIFLWGETWIHWNAPCCLLMSSSPQFIVASIIDLKCVHGVIVSCPLLIGTGRSPINCSFWTLQFDLSANVPWFTLHTRTHIHTCALYILHTMIVYYRCRCPLCPLQFKVRSTSLYVFWTFFLLLLLLLIFLMFYVRVSHFPSMIRCIYHCI